MNVGAVVEQAAEETFTRYELENPPGYPLVWEVLRETLIDLLKEVVARDLAELSSSGYRPESFETELENYLPWEKPKNLKGLLLHGRIDRIDCQPQERKYRVVDYKLKTTACWRRHGASACSLLSMSCWPSALRRVPGKEGLRRQSRPHSIMWPPDGKKDPW